MLTSINPLGERIRGNRWISTVGWLIVGGAVGGAALGAAAGAIGLLVTRAVGDPARLVVLIVTLVTAAVWDLSGRRFPGRRQVDENWLTTYRSWVYGFGFGAQLGAGLATVVNTALVPVMLVAAVLTESIVTACIIGMAFGTTRGVTVLLTGSVRSPDDLRDLHRRIDEVDDQARWVGAVLALVLAVVVAVALGVQ